MADIVNRSDVAQSFDVRVQGAIADAQSKVSQNRQGGEQDDIAADQQKKGIDKKLLLKLQEKKLEANAATQNESFALDDGAQKRWQAATDGRMGQDVASAALGWSDSGNLQAKLTQAQKRMFQEAFSQDPQRAKAGAEALARLSGDPAFPKAMASSQDVALLQTTVLEAPHIEEPVRNVLQSRFAQSPKADPGAKSDFIRFGLQQAAKGGDLAAVKAAGDMLGVLVKTNTPMFAQRDAMNMVQRNPANTEGVANVDAFAQEPSITEMPTMARGYATSSLARADGDKMVKTGFEKLAQDPTFRGQDDEVKGRFFATIGSGRASELRAITDKTLQALASPQFPTRSNQVGLFLNKMDQKVKAKGATGVDVGDLIKQAKTSPFPPVPVLDRVEGRTDEEAREARLNNTGKLMKYFNAVDNAYDNVGKRLESAKYFEKVHSLPGLREVGDIDLSHQPPEIVKLVTEKTAEFKAQHKELKRSQVLRMRELRSSRISPKRQAMLEERSRARGQQPRYFTPGRAMNPQAASQALRSAPQFPTSQGLPNMEMSRPGAATMQGGGQGLDVQALLAQLPANMPMEQKLQRATQLITKNVQTYTENVMRKLVQTHKRGAVSAFEPETLASVSHEENPVGLQDGEAPKKRQKTLGKTDGWGIPRTFEKDLGSAADVVPVRPPQEGERDGSDALGALAPEKYTGRTLVRAQTQVRPTDQLLNLPWKELSKAETALMRNLGWTQPMWNAKYEATAQWPQAMRTPYKKLTGTQRESVRGLGLDDETWDGFVAQLSGSDPR